MGRARRAAALEALTQRYRDHVEFLRGRMVAMGVPASAADDAAHDVLEILVRRIEDYDDRYSLRQWMSGMARRVAKRHRERAARQADELPEVEAGPATDPERRISLREDAALLERFLDGLDPDKWAVFVLSEVEGLRGSEIAAELDVNLNTVYARLRASRIQLDRMLARRRARDRRWLGLGFFVDRLLPPGGASSAAAFVSVRATLAMVATVLALVVLWWLAARPTDDAPSNGEAHAAAEFHGAAESRPRAVGEPDDADAPVLETASIEGRVIDPTGDAIADAEVCAWPTSDVLRRAAGATCTRSDQEGHYHIEGLRPAQILLSAGAQGFHPGHIGHQPWSEPLLMQPAQRRSHIDIVLQPGGVTISGRIVDATGGPIPGARVLGDRNLTPSSLPHRGIFVTADDEGRFAVPASPGIAALRVEASGYASAVEHTSAPARDLEIALVPAAQMSGMVVEAGSGKPVGGAMVQAHALDEGARVVGTTMTGIEGRFELAGLHPGRYLASATAPGRAGTSPQRVVLGLGDSANGLRIETESVATVSARVVTDDGDPCRRGYAVLVARGTQARYVFPIAHDGSVRFWALDPGTYDPVVLCETHRARESYAPVSVDRDPVEELRWLVSRGGTIGGRVERVEPDDGLWVRATGLDGERATIGVSVAPDGAFALEGLPPGRYTVRVAGLHHPPSEALEISLAAEESVDDVLIELALGATIRGSVLDEAEQPVGGVRIEVHGETGPHYSPTYAANDGSFTITGLPPGRYRVETSRPGDVEPARSDPVVVAASETAQVALRVPVHDAAIRGSVVDEEGSPVSDGFVMAQPQNPAASTTSPPRPVVTETDGSFELTGLPPVPHRLQAHLPGGAAAKVDDVRPGRDVRVVIPRTGTLSGTVRVVGGHAPQWALLEIRNGSSDLPRVELLRDEAAFSIPGLPAGTYTLTATGLEGATTIEGIGLKAGERIDDLTVELGQRSTVVGRVVDLGTGEPIAGIAVQIGSRNEPAPEGNNWSTRPGSHVTDADGTFVVHDVIPGRVWVVGTPSHPDTMPYAGFRLPEVVSGDGKVTLPDVGLPALDRPPRHMPAVTLGFSPDVDALAGPGVEPRLVLRNLAPDLAATGGRPGDVVLAIDGHDITGRNIYLADSLLSVLPDTTVSLELQGGATLTVIATPYLE